MKRTLFYDLDIVDSDWNSWKPPLFFLIKTDLYYQLRKYICTYNYRHVYVRIHRPLCHPSFTKNHKQQRNYSEAPQSLENQPWSTTSLVAATAEEEVEQHNELERSLRTLA
jgi:hypothetical protein